MGGILQKMLQAFYTKKLEVVLVGLENRCGGPVAFASVNSSETFVFSVLLPSF